MGAPRSPTAPAGPSHPRWRVLLGNLDCDVDSADDRYPAMLAAAYGATVLPAARPPAVLPDLRISIREDGRGAPESHADRLIVSRGPGMTVLASDPMTWEVCMHARPCLVSVTVHDPALPEDRLAYHFWILLNRTLLLLGRLTLHAAALAYQGSVSLFAGPKGAGKSTVSVRLARAGATLLADDHLLARRAGDRLAVSGCSGRLRVTERTEAHLLPGVLGPETIDVSGVIKKEFPAARYFAARPHEERAVDRLFVLRLGSRFEIRPARRQAVLLRLLGDTGAMLRFHDRADYDDFLAAVANLVAVVPCHELDLSPRLADLDRLVQFLERPA